MKKANLEVIGTAMLPEQKILNKVSAKEIAEVLEKEATEKIIKNRVLGIVCDAMAAVERAEIRVADIVVGPDTYNVLRKYLPLDPYTSTKEIKTGLFADLYGARVWVDKEVVGLRCFGEDSKELGKQFPSIIKAKKLLKIEDI